MSKINHWLSTNGWKKIKIALLNAHVINNDWFYKYINFIRFQIIKKIVWEMLLSVWVQDDVDFYEGIFTGEKEKQIKSS